MSLPYFTTPPPRVDHDSASTRVMIMKTTLPLILVGVLCLLSRFLWKCFRSPGTLPAEANVSQPLPSFTAENRAGDDCVVCISTFEQDQLSVMPLCGHAFHADCINAWIVIKPTCPVCRSEGVASSEAMIVDSNRSSNSSTRVEISSSDMDSGAGSSPRSEPSEFHYDV